MSQSPVVSLVYGAARDTSSVGTAESALKFPVVAGTLTVSTVRYFFLAFDFETSGKTFASCRWCKLHLFTYVVKFFFHLNVRRFGRGDRYRVAPKKRGELWHAVMQ